MHTRQSGAAHVPIMFFLMLLVMFLGAVGFAYITADGNSKLSTDNAALRADAKVKENSILLMTDYIKELGDVLKLPGKYAGRASVEYSGANLDGVAGVVSPEELKKKLGEFGAGIEIGATSGIEDTLAAATNRVGALKKRSADLETERDTVLAQKNETDAKFTAAEASHSKAAGEWRQSLEQARTDFATASSTATSTITSLQENVRRGEETLATEKEERSTEKKQLKSDIAKLQMHNTALVDRTHMITPPSVADGKVIASKGSLPTAFVNLGRKDMLQRGTIFQVKNPSESKVKGYARVLEVEQDRAKVELYDLADKVGDPVRDGDEIYNDLYSPGQGSKRTIYLLGRFSYPYHKPQLELHLKNLGNTVVSKMGPGVDTVILGDDAVNEAGDGFAQVLETEEYKTAVQLGVEFVPMRKIRDLVRAD